MEEARTEEGASCREDWPAAGGSAHEYFPSVLTATAFTCPKALEKVRALEYKDNKTRKESITSYWRTHFGQ